MKGRRGKDADLSCSRNANILTHPPPVRQDAPITSQKTLVGRAQMRFSVLIPHREGEISELGRSIL
jgi:hypothetical protein